MVFIIIIINSHYPRNALFFVFIAGQRYHLQLYVNHKSALRSVVLVTSAGSFYVRRTERYTQEMKTPATLGTRSRICSQELNAVA